MSELRAALETKTPATHQRGPTMTPDLSRFEDLYCDLAPEPELNEFGHLAKLIAAHGERYRIEDQAFILTRLCLIAGFHMGSDYRELWPLMQRSYDQLMTDIEHGNETGVKH